MGIPVFGMRSGIASMTDTPGVFYAFSYSISLFLTAFFMRKKQKDMDIWFYGALFTILICSIMIATASTESKLVFILVEIIVFLSMACMLHQCSDLAGWREAFYYAVRSFLIAEFSASLVWQIMFFLIRNLHLPDYLILVILFTAFGYLLIYSMIFLIDRKWHVQNKELTVSSLELLEAFLVGIGFYILSNLSYAIQATPFSSSSVKDTFIIRTLADLGGVAILETFHLMLLDRKVQVEKELLKKMLDMQYDNYRISEESLALVNQKYHDLKHQIHLLKEGSSDEEKNGYLDRMEKDIQKFESRVQTGSKYLDTILGTKSLQCQNENITMIMVADGESLSILEPMDICALFGNALDNAIEGVRQVDRQDRRLIHVSVSRQRNFLRIRIENCYDGEIFFRNGLPVTSKEDNRYHGFGTRSIRSIVEKYSGSMTIDAKDGWYRLKILIPSN